MQKAQYDLEASKWSIDDRGWVVGSFDAHNNWNDYDTFLFKDKITKGKIALDFGCGPGRNIVKFANRFAQIDGVDISQTNLDNANIWCQANNITMVPTLFHNNGQDLSCITTDNYYDFVFSTITLQHICVYNIRFQLFTDFYRLLKSDGSICIQMGFGKRIGSVDYYDNFYDANGTNGACDTRIENVNQIKNDLYKIGFVDFEFDIRPVGPGDAHESWIFFRCNK
jgi:ubiquinone/menaquinone biosynthesis C-methylase UbiE